MSADELEEGTFVKDLPFVQRGPKGQRQYDWAKIADKCRSQPGEWLLAARNCPRTHAQLIKTGQKKAFPGGSENWLVTTTGARNKPGDLYIAYVGVPGARRKALEAAKGRKLTRSGS